MHSAVDGPHINDDCGINEHFMRDEKQTSSFDNTPWTVKYEQCRTLPE